MILLSQNLQPIEKVVTCVSKVNCGVEVVVLFVEMLYVSVMILKRNAVRTTSMNVRLVKLSSAISGFYRTPIICSVFHANFLVLLQAMVKSL